MRKILFKAKRLDKEKWVEGSLLSFKDGDSFICREDYIPEMMTKYEVDPQTVCQYTGLKDKNGKKIFEGDILKYGENTAVVKYSFFNCGCCYDVFGYILQGDFDCFYSGLDEVDYKCNIEIIGNIFDKKEKQK